MIKNFTSKKKKKTQKYTKTFFKKSSHTLKNKKHRVKINPTSISSNFVGKCKIFENSNPTKIPNPSTADNQSTTSQPSYK